MEVAANKSCECEATILCVDDNPFNLMPLTMLLKNKLGINVMEALNGAQAVEKFVANRNSQFTCNCGIGFRLILMDINMPVMDGCTATKHIISFQKQYEESIKEDNVERKAMGQPLIPIIPLKISAITSYTNKANIDECFTVGMDEVIHKPVDFTTLKDIMNRFYYTEEEMKKVPNA